MRWGIAIALLCACGESHTTGDAATTDASVDSRDDVDTPDVDAGTEPTVTLLAQGDQVFAISLDHSARQTRVHGIMDGSITLADGTLLEALRTQDPFVFEVNDTRHVWSAVAGAPGDPDDLYWIGKVLWIQPDTGLTRVFGHTDGNALWNATSLPRGAIRFDVSRSGSVSNLQTVEIPGVFQVARSDTALFTAAMVPSGERIEVGGVERVVPEGDPMMIAAFDTGGELLWLEWLDVDNMIAFEVVGSRLRVAAEISAGATALGLAPDSTATLLASFSEDGSRDAGLIPFAFSVEFLDSEDGGLFIQLTGSDRGPRCAALRVSSDMSVSWMEALAGNLGCEVRRVAGGLIVSSNNDVLTQTLAYLDETNGRSRWSRTFSGSLAVDDEGYWQASNVGEDETLLLGGESFETDDGMVVFARFNLDNTLEFVHALDTRGIQATALQGFFGFDQFANLDRRFDRRLYSWVETRNGDRASQLALVEVSASGVRSIEFDADTEGTCVFNPPGFSGCPIAVAGDQVYAWAAWSNGTLTVDSVTLAAAETTFASGALIRARF